MSAMPIPELPEPATAADLGHRLRYPLKVGEEWRASCNCHWFWRVDSAEAEAAVK